MRTVFVAALALRLGLVAVLQVVPPDVVGVVDDGTYIQIAADVASGNTSAWDPHVWALYRSTAAYSGPLTVLFWIFGVVPIFGNLLSALFGAIAAAGLVWLARPALGTRAALAAGLVATVYPSMVLWSSLTLKDSAVWAVAIGLAGALVRLQQSKGGRQAARWAVASTALLLGLGHLRIHSFLVASFAMVIYLAATTPRRKLLQRVGGGLLVATVAPMLIGLGPGGIRYVLTQGDQVDNTRAANALLASTAFVDDSDQVAVGVDGSSQQQGEATVETHVGEMVPVNGGGNERIVVDVTIRVLGESLESSTGVPLLIEGVVVDEDGRARDESGEDITDLTVGVTDSGVVVGVPGAHIAPDVVEALLEASEAVVTAEDGAQPTVPSNSTAAGVELTPTAPGATGSSGGLTSLRRGLVAVLLEPFPWRDYGNARLNVARAEMILWYPVLAFATVFMLRGAFRNRRETGFMMLYLGGVTLVYALAEGNLGTAFRHRAELIPFALILALHGLMDTRWGSRLREGTSE